MAKVTKLNVMGVILFSPKIMVELDYFLLSANNFCLKHICNNLPICVSILNVSTYTYQRCDCIRMSTVLFQQTLNSIAVLAKSRSSFLVKNECCNLYSAV